MKFFKFILFIFLLFVEIFSSNIKTDLNSVEEKMKSIILGKGYKNMKQDIMTLIQSVEIIQNITYSHDPSSIFNLI